MKDTQLNHVETFDPKLSLEEMLAYIDQSMDMSKRKRVEAILSENPIYAEAVASLRGTIEQDDASRDWLHQVDSTFNQTVDTQAKMLRIPTAPNSRKSGISKRIWFITTAAAVIIAALSFGIMQYSQPPKEVRLAEAYLTHYVDPLGVLSQVEDQAYALYNQQNYVQAIPLLEQLILDAEPGKQNKLRMLLGVSHVQIKQDDAAIEYFRQIIDHGESIYVTAAKWYMALALLRQNETKEGKQLLEEIAASTQTDRQTKFYAEKAQELLLKLN